MAEQNHRWWIVAAAGCTLGVILLDETVVGLSLPLIKEKLQLSDHQSHWVVNAYLLALTCMVAVCGKLGDVVGLKRWYFVGAAVFGIGAFFSGATSFPIPFRAIQGLGTAILFPVSIAIVTLVFPKEKRGLGIGSFGAIGTSFIPISALTGGFLMTALSWRFVFWLSLPILLATSLIVYFFYEDRTQKKTIALKDLRGLFSLVMGLILFVIGLMEAHLLGFSSPYIIGLLAASLCILTYFVSTEAKNPNPLIEVNLFLRPTFSASALILFTAQYVKISIAVFGAIYLQQKLNMTPFGAALALFPGMLFYPFVTIIAGYVTDRFDSKKLILTALALVALALLIFGLLVNNQNYLHLIAPIILLGIGTPFLFVPAITDLMGSVSEEKRGQAGGISLTVQILGGAISIAVLGVYISEFSKLFLTASATTAIIWLIVWRLRK